MSRAQRVGIDAEPRRFGWTEAVDDDVGTGEERIEHARRGRRAEIERDAPLAAVQQVEIGCRAAGIARWREPRRKLAHAVAAVRILHLDDVGAEIGQKQRRVCARQQPREIEHPHAGKRRLHQRSACHTCAARDRSLLWV